MLGLDNKIKNDNIFDQIPQYYHYIVGITFGTFKKN